jgi:hypothetical protein
MWRAAGPGKIAAPSSWCGAWFSFNMLCRSRLFRDPAMSFGGRDPAPILEYS